VSFLRYREVDGYRVRRETFELLNEWGPSGSSGCGACPPIRMRP